MISHVTYWVTSRGHFKVAQKQEFVEADHLCEGQATIFSPPPGLKQPLSTIMLQVVK